MNCGKGCVRKRNAGAWLARTIIAACFGAGGELVRADEFDTLNLTLAETLRHDDNLFRLPAGTTPSAAAAGSSSRSDQIRSESVTLSLDKHLSLQRIHFSASVTSNRYRNFAFLNHVSKSYEGYWAWQVTPHLRGRIAAERLETLNSFADYQGFQRNVRTGTNRSFDAEYGVFGNWRLTAGVSQGGTENSALFVQTGDTASRAASVGIRYVTLADNWVSLTTRFSRVDWKNRVLDLVNQHDVRADQHNAEIRMRWRVTGKSVVEAAIDRVTRTHDTVSSRNFSGTGGRLDMTWVGSGKTQVRLGIGRDFESWWEASSSYVRRDHVSLTPAWQPTARTRIRLNLERHSRDYLGPVFPSAISARHDLVNLSELSFAWGPQRNLTLATTLLSEERSSNLSGFSYDDKTMMFSAQIGF